MKKTLSFILTLALAGSVFMLNGPADKCSAESVGSEDPVFKWDLEKIGAVMMDEEKEYQISDELSVTCYIAYKTGIHLTGFKGSANGKLEIPSEIYGYKVTSIGSNAFKNCTGLTSVIIPDSVDRIWYSAFSGCTELESVALPDSISVIEARAFNDCTSLTSINIPENVTEIENGAFQNCTALTEINIPDSVKEIEFRAFDNSGWYNNQPDGMIFMGNFLCGYKGTVPENSSLVIPDNVVSISDGAFTDQTGITSVTFPKNIDRIRPVTFTGCTGLTSVTIPGNVITVMYSAFERCSDLKTVTIENGVKNIQSWAFSGCPSLSKVIIPESVTFIGNEVFKDGGGDLTIYGYKDSVAEKYAQVNGIRFELLGSEETPAETTAAPVTTKAPVTTAKATSKVSSASNNNSPKTGDRGVIPAMAATVTAAALAVTSFKKKS